MQPVAGWGPRDWKVPELRTSGKAAGAKESGSLCGAMLGVQAVRSVCIAPGVRLPLSTFAMRAKQGTVRVSPAALHRITNEARQRFEPELPHQPCSMRLHGPDADAQSFSN